MDKTTISLSKETKADFDDARPPNANSADAFIRMLLEAWQGEGADAEREQTIDVEDARLLAEHVERTLAPYLDDIQGSASTAEERTGSIENTLENMGGR